MNTYVTMYKCKVCKQLSDAHRPEDLKPNCSEHGGTIEEIKWKSFTKIQILTFDYKGVNGVNKQELLNESEDIKNSHNSVNP